MAQKLSFTVFVILLGLGIYFFPSFSETGAGVAILLFGIINLENGFKVYSEGPIRQIIRKRTKNLASSISLGIVSTALMQSSSLVSVLVISFISAGLITLKAGIGVIFGANIGTTFTGWLVAVFGLNFNISTFAMPLIIFGVVFVIQKAARMKALGYILVGMGFLFLGISYIKTGFEGLQDQIQLTPPFAINALNLLFYTGIGIIATVIMQSSAATLAIIITALSINQISYEQSLALAIGSNVGTTITAILGAMAADEAGKRIAAAHLIFNLITGTIALLFLKPISLVVEKLCSIVSIAPDNFILQLAMFHTVFNFIGVGVMVPWVNALIRFLNRIIKDKKPDVVKPKYLNEAVLMHPESAINALYKETEHLMDLSIAIIAKGLSVQRKDIIIVKKVSTIVEAPIRMIQIDIDEEYAKKIKSLYSKIIKYTAIIQYQELSPDQQNKVSNIKNANILIVEVIKELKVFQLNLGKFINSDDEDIVDIYNYFRKRIIQVIRGLFGDSINYPYHSDEIEDISKIKFDILKQKRRIKRLKEEVNDKISNLIIQKNISSKMASSVLNDSLFVFRICSNLLKIIELMYYQESDYIIEQQ